MYKRLFVVVVIQKSINSFLNKYFRRKKEKVSKIETDNLIKMAFFANQTGEVNNADADNLMKILMIEKFCKGILDEVEILKNNIVKVENNV
jgi:hypothetical protein